jgi:hypothetical protein
MDRRTFLRATTSLIASASISSRSQSRADFDSFPRFSTGNKRWQAAYNEAMRILVANVHTLPRFNGEVLLEGADYPGIWQECGPHEALVYRNLRPDVACNSHLTFFALQRPDGQLPANNKLIEAGFGQIQMVVPIAATAWELASATGDDELLQAAYVSCSRWDNWLSAYRNTRKSGLVEGFCTYDTGHDNSPRWTGIPPQCPGKDAKRFPPIATLPRLCPDLSATVYGGRIALASMAHALGKSSEAEHWQLKADQIRNLILKLLYVEEDAAFYDLDAQGNFVKVRSDVLSRVCGEHVLDQKTFDHVWQQQLHNPMAFWAPIPLPSIALDDPHFVWPLERNSWGGPSQALTALRAGRWFDHYNRSAEFTHMMNKWCEALQSDMTFRQQLDPLTGEFTQADQPGYSPACLVMYDYTWRLAGVRDEVHELHWNVRPGHAASEMARFEVLVGKHKSAVMEYDRTSARLTLGGRMVAHITGTCRLLTKKDGKLQKLVGISEKTERVTVKTAHQTRHYLLRPNQQISIS